MNGLALRTDFLSRLVRTALLLSAAGPLLFAQPSFTDDERRAAAGEAKAMTALGRRYETGEGCPRDAGQAILWFRRAAALGEPGAMVALGDIYDEGKCVDQSMGTAVRYFRQAAALGHAPAMHRL